MIQEHFKRFELSEGIVTQSQTHGTTPRCANHNMIYEVDKLRPVGQALPHHLFL